MLVDDAIRLIDQFQPTLRHMRHRRGRDGRVAGEVIAEDQAEADQAGNSDDNANRDADAETNEATQHGDRNIGNTGRFL